MIEKPKRVYVRSFGCPTNLADEETIIDCLLEAGYEVVQKIEDADILIYNTCAVKTPTENRIMNILKNSPANKKLIVTGCLPLINLERLRAEARADGIVGPSPGIRIVEAVSKVGNGQEVIILEKDFKSSLNVSKVRSHKVISIVPINYGCLGSCSYCCVVFARGRLRSCKIDEIVERIKFDVVSGTREIWLTSQDTGCYGKDIGTNLSTLLRRICKIDEEFLVRLGMMTPNNALESLDELIQVYKDEKIFKFLHLPVQSGDDEILKNMNRFYSTEDFKKIVYRFREETPDITIATDVICGFPSESNEAFNKTLKLIEETQPDIVNVSKFFPRPHTIAEKMKPYVPLREVSERSKKVAELAKNISLEKNKKWAKWEGKILVDEKGKVPGSWIGRNSAYKPIVVKSEESLLGKFIDIRVVKTFATYLKAKIL
jgi:threonylcarbamoyladenosine tRNA methylthiotransferase CDKAL1